MGNFEAKLGERPSKSAVKYDKVERFGRDVGLAGKKYHFIGAGGVGMSGLARMMMNNGAAISGSDQAAGEVVEKLNQAGADIKTGHSELNLPAEVEAVVISAAIRQDNTELTTAVRRGIKVYKYAEMLGRVMDCYNGVAVCGTHGKSTTSGWLAFVLSEAGLSPSFIIGADVIQFAGSAGVGDGQYFVAEACEYDRSFLNLHPEIMVMLNIEQDHLDYYRDEAEIVEAFAEFTDGLADGGVIIANGQDENVRKIIEQVKLRKRCVSFGYDLECDFSAQNLTVEAGLYSFDVYRSGQILGRAKLGLAGEHNVLNGLAVIAAAVEAGVSVEAVLSALPRFVGVDRRMMLKARLENIVVMDDYAHHPTEIKASLAAIRQRFSPGRIFCVFQPHQYSRTRFLLDDFAESFKLCDITIVPKIYFVRDTELARRQVNSQILVEKIRDKGCQAVFIEKFTAICGYLKANVRQGDLIVTMGAGDIWKVADEYIQWLKGNS